MAKILVIDDEPLVCEMLDVFLTRAGHTIETAENGECAMEIVEKNQFDVVIVDIVMPQKDGLETIMELQKLRPDFKILAISGGARVGNFDFLAAAKSFGACATFYKPLDNAQLLLAVDKCLQTTDLQNVASVAG